MVFPYTLNYYDYDKGYENTNVGWYEHVIYTDSESLQRSAVRWLYDNIDNPERHCRWCRYQDKFCVKFRFEKNYLWFSLSF